MPAAPEDEFSADELELLHTMRCPNHSGANCVNRCAGIFPAIACLNSGQVDASAVRAAIEERRRRLA